MSKYFDIVKNFYDKGLWKEDRVRDAVIKGWITADEYEIITGTIYKSDVKAQQ